MEFIKCKKYMLIVLGLVSLLLQGCAPSVYNIDEPDQSDNKYTKKDSKKYKGLYLVDSRIDTEKVFSSGTLTADLTIAEKPIEPIAYLKKYTEKELKSKGLNISLNQSNGIKIDILKFNINNQRTNAYTPFNTFTMLSADINLKNKKHRIAAYIHRGKVPVWGFGEIVEPTLNQPMELVVKEFAAKLNNRLYGQRVSSEKVRDMAARILNAPAGEVDYLDVYELGFSNNWVAIKPLKKLTKHNSEYVRMAAISSIGTLRDKKQLSFLKSIYNNSQSWHDRAIAIKAIGDLSTPESHKFLLKEKNSLLNSSKEDQWIHQVIDLYIL